MSTHNLRSYKLATIYIRDLDAIIINTERAIASYKPLKHYKSAGRILRHLEEELDIQKTHRQNCEVIVQSKGKVIEEGNGKKHKDE